MKKPDRKWAIVSVTLAGIALLAYLARGTILERIIRGAMIRKIQQIYDMDKILDSRLYPGMRVVLAGTGTPIADRQRSSPCTAVIAGGEFLVFDDGGEGLRQLQILGYPTHRIDRVFLTHLHSDHMSGVGRMIDFSWIYGRKKPIHLYGPDDSNRLTHSLYPPTSEEYIRGTETTGGRPDRRRINQLAEADLVPGARYIPGVRHVVQGFSMAFYPDIIIRASNRQMPAGYYEPARAQVIPHPIPDMDSADSPPDFGWGELKTVYESADQGLKVKAFLVDHYPCFPSYGYRIEYAGRAVVISGDTEKLTYMARCAVGADLLIHEAMNMAMVDRIAMVIEDHFGDKVWAGQIRAAASHHTDTLDVARAARDAGVAKLVLTHIGPSPPNRAVRRMFLKGMAAMYKGPIVLGEDGMEFYLEPVP